MTTLAAIGRSPLGASRELRAAGTFTVLGLVDIGVFGLLAHQGDATFAMSLTGAAVHVPSIRVPATSACYVFGAVSVAVGFFRGVRPAGARTRRATIAAVLAAFVLSLLCWSDAGNAIPLNVVNLLQGTLAASIPLVLGALAGCMCERSGVINIAIEGQLLLGAFTAAVVTSAIGVLWLGVVAGSLAGGLVGVVLAVFAINFLVDQIILGVVLNLLVSGLTGFLFDRVLTPYANTLNSPETFAPLKIPLLADIPVIGPVFFNSTIFLYITYIMIVAVQVGLFRTRWGLRVRAVGEHPTAADTVGIRVLGIRYGNVIMGGLLAGIGGAYLTIGSVGEFSKGMSSGMGYIALAAMIFGRWTPLGGTAAALLFGFSLSLEQLLSTIPGVPIESNILLMAPYIATIVAVAGLVGHVRPPAADGQPYVKA
jgi:simple sugar transport system permease protein